MNKSKLNFSQLENEYELLSLSKASSIKGGLENVGNLGTVTIYGEYNNSNSYDWSGFLGQFTINSQGQAIFSDNVGSATGGSIGTINLSTTLTTLGNMADASAAVASLGDNMGAVKAFGNLSNAAAAAGIGIDAAALLNHYNNNIGDMDGFRFSIRTGTLGAALVAGNIATGGTGVVVGVLIGGAGAGTEYMYDQTLETLHRLWGNFVNNYGMSGAPMP